MFESIYAGYSGLLSFSKGLSVLSNNVANMNSPGFKSSDLMFRDLVYRYGLDGGNTGGNSSLQLGQGVDTTATRINFAQGEFRESSNSLDTAIDGNGFFILRKDGKTFYSRGGQFEFNDDGILVQRGSDAHVAAFNNGALEDISKLGIRTNPPKATGTVVFRGQLFHVNLNPDQNTHTVNITVYDNEGVSHLLNVLFTDNGTTATGTSWHVEVRDAGTLISAAGAEIRYRADTTPETGFNTLDINLNSTTQGQSTIHLNFGDVGGLLGTTSPSGSPDTSNLVMQSQDGYGVGSLVDTTFDEDGVLTAKYSNGQTTKNQRLALAWFDNLQQLSEVGQGLFSNSTDQKEIRNVAGSGPFGKIVPKKFELSNVELTEQFTNMVVIQRGYQASSQIVSVTNEMIQQLLDIRSRR